jgi:hypothetical protein
MNGEGCEREREWDTRGLREGEVSRRAAHVAFAARERGRGMREGEEGVARDEWGGV